MGPSWLPSPAPPSLEKKCLGKLQRALSLLFFFFLAVIASTGGGGSQIIQCRWPMTMGWSQVSPGNCCPVACSVQVAGGAVCHYGPVREMRRRTLPGPMLCTCDALLGSRWILGSPEPDVTGITHSLTQSLASCSLAYDTRLRHSRPRPPKPPLEVRGQTGGRRRPPPPSGSAGLDLVSIFPEGGFNSARGRERVIGHCSWSWSGSMGAWERHGCVRQPFCRGAGC